MVGMIYWAATCVGGRMKSSRGLEHSKTLRENRMRLLIL